MKAVAYGSLYMDEGEGFEKAKEQIDFFTEQPNPVTAMFFSVIDYEKNRINGEQMARKIEEYARTKFKNLEITVGFESTESTREKPRN